jgi:hypothetical protein
MPGGGVVRHRLRHSRYSHRSSSGIGAIHRRSRSALAISSKLGTPICPSARLWAQRVNPLDGRLENTVADGS